MLSVRPLYAVKQAVCVKSSHLGLCPALPRNDPLPGMCCGGLEGWEDGAGGGGQVCCRGVGAQAVTPENTALFSVPGRGPASFLGLSFPILIDSSCDLSFQEGGDWGEGGWMRRRGESGGAEGALDPLTSCLPVSAPGLET